MEEGQNKLSVDLYHKLGKYFMAEGQVDANFINTWSWNLMCRCKNSTKLTASALSWNHDCIAVAFGQTKTDKSGKNSHIPRHVFANPFQPWVIILFA